MRNNEIINVNDKEITVKELTVTQIDNVFGSFDINRQAARSEMLLDSLIPIEVVSEATGLKDEELNGNFTPSELNQIWEAVAKANPFLCQMLSRLASTITKLSGDTIGRPSEDLSPA